MKHSPLPIAAPLTVPEATTLREYATGAVTAKSIAAERPADRLVRATVEQALAARGLLVKLPKERRVKNEALYVPTPEGLATLVGSVPIEVLVPGCHPVGEPTALSKAGRTSAAPCAPRSRGRC